MDDTTLIFALVFVTAIGYWANSWGRRWWVWSGLALFITPLITSLALLVMGRVNDDEVDDDNSNNQVDADDPAITELRIEEVLQANEQAINKLQEEQTRMREMINQRSNNHI